MLPKPKLKKVLLIGVPLVLFGSVGAYAATGIAKGASATASASTGTSQSQGEVTSKTVSSEPLTSTEMAQLGNVQPAPSNPSTTATTTGITQSQLDASNPFLVQSPTTGSSTSGATDTTSGQTTNNNTTTASTGTGTTTASSAPFDINQVKNLQLQTNTTQGLLVLHFTADDKNNLKLDGQLGNHHLTVQGAQAEQILSQVLQNLNLGDAFTAALQGQQVNLDNNVLSSLQNVQIEMKDGRQIKSQPKGGPKKEDNGDNNNQGNAPAAPPGHDPKAVGAHDNGKHKGEEKHGKKHGD